MNPLGKVLCSKPVAFTLGVGLGLVGMYAYARTTERRKLEQSEKELAEAIAALKAHEAARTAGDDGKG